MQVISENKSFGGTQGVYAHDSNETDCTMHFAAYVPEHSPNSKLPILWYLSGLTCTHANVMEKGDYRKAASELGLIIIAPDTSPRGDDIPDDKAYDLGQGAGFYVDATKEPWSKHYRMRSYIEKELPLLIAKNFPIDISRQGIFGHSMGGHGALTIGLRNSDRFKSISAFAPIVSPMQCPWGEKALSAYIGYDRQAWREYDACALIEDRKHVPELLIDQGSADTFLKEQLKPELLEKTCRDNRINYTLNMRKGYDHSYYFISTFMEGHLRWHSSNLLK